MTGSSRLLPGRWGLGSVSTAQRGAGREKLFSSLFPAIIIVLVTVERKGASPQAQGTQETPPVPHCLLRNETMSGAGSWTEEGQALGCLVGGWSVGMVYTGPVTPPEHTPRVLGCPCWGLSSEKFTGPS